MLRVISLERALAEQSSAESLLAIADWHDDRLADLERAASRYKGKRKDGSAVVRHRDTAKELRRVAGQLTAALHRAAA